MDTCPRTIYGRDGDDDVDDNDVVAVDDAAVARRTNLVSELVIEYFLE